MAYNTAQTMYPGGPGWAELSQLGFAHDASSGRVEVKLLEAINKLGYALPVPLQKFRVHMDEGTGVRKTAIYQYSWGPVIPKDVNSCNRYFFWSCIFHEQYKKHHAGYEGGNAVLDDVMQHLADELTSVYTDGIMVGATTYFLVWVELEGDLPAQAKAMH
eukprot:s267_g30.t1